MKSKQTLKVFILFVAIILTQNLNAQENSNKCKVLLKSISGNYEGGCKKGLANGKGVAKGVDTYEGKFKKGYPNGYGVYTWKNGDVYEGNWEEGKREGKGKMYFNSISKDSVVYAYWVDDKFVKEIELPSYTITYKSSNLSRISFTEELGERNDIEFVLMRNGRIIRSFTYIDFLGSSGSAKQTANYLGFENVVYPFEGTLRFKASNQFNTAVYDYILKFKINKAGSWKIIVNF